jgi:hypothetical protein
MAKNIYDRPDFFAAYKMLQRLALLHYYFVEGRGPPIGLSKAW